MGVVEIAVFLGMMVLENYELLQEKLRIGGGVRKGLYGVTLIVFAFDRRMTHAVR